MRVRFPPPALLRGGRQRDAGPNLAETGSPHIPLYTPSRSETLRVEALLRGANFKPWDAKTTHRFPSSVPFL